MKLHPSAFFLTVLMVLCAWMALPSTVHARRGGGAPAAEAPEGGPADEDNAEAPAAPPAAKTPSKPVSKANAKAIKKEDLKVLPDELTVRTPIEKDGKDVTVLLKKRSIRSDNYVSGVWSSGGFTKIIFPVSTYRGYVKEDPILRVNASVEPGGIVEGLFTQGHQIHGSLNVKCAQAVGADKRQEVKPGNKVVALKKTRTVPTKMGYLTPTQPMRRIRVAAVISKDYVEQVEQEGGSIQTCVARVEQRFNDCDHFFARDVGCAWEVAWIVVNQDGSAVDFGKIPARDNTARFVVNFAGIHSRAGTGGGQIFKGGPGWSSWMLAGGIGGGGGGGVSHEGGHKFQASHYAGERPDCMKGNSCVGMLNLQLMCKYFEAYWGAAHAEAVCPAIVYDSPLAPYAMDDFANTHKDKPVTIDVLENDYDGNGDTISLQDVDSKSEKGGKVALSNDKKSVVYTPPRGYVGTDHFKYTSVDATGVGNREGYVRVDVSTPGLAHYYPFDDVPKPVHVRKRTICEQPDSGPYKVGLSAWSLDPLSVKGVKGNAVYNDSLAVKGYLFAGGCATPGLWSMTISLWVLFPDEVSLDMKDWKGNDMGCGGVIVCQGGALSGAYNGGALGGWVIGHLENGKGFGFSGNTVAGIGENCFELRSTEKLQPKKWYHLVMMMDREKKVLRAWVNNRELTVGKKTIPEGAITGDNLNLFNGYSWKQGVTSRCVIDELRIYNGTLTPQKISELYAEGAKAPIPVIKTTPVPVVAGKPEENGKAKTGAKTAVLADRDAVSE